MDYSVKSEVEESFASLGIPVVCNHHYLCEFLGESASQDAFVVQDKVHKWVACQNLTKMAVKQP